MTEEEEAGSSCGNFSHFLVSQAHLTYSSVQQDTRFPSLKGIMLVFRADAWNTAKARLILRLESL